MGGPHRHDHASSGASTVSRMIAGRHDGSDD
jgi:hypothetical protein